MFKSIAYFTRTNEKKRNTKYGKEKITKRKRNFEFDQFYYPPKFKKKTNPDLVHGCSSGWLGSVGTFRQSRRTDPTDGLLCRVGGVRLI